MGRGCALYRAEQGLQSLRPGLHGLGHGGEVIGGGGAGDALARLEVVVAVFQPEDFDGFREFVAGYFFAGAEFITGSLADQRRGSEPSFCGDLA